MEGFIFDTHIHTKPSSICGRIESEEIVALYKQAGYSGIVITDHYYNGFFDGLDGMLENADEMPWEEKAERFCAGYRAAKAAGDKLGLVVLFGQEMRFLEHPNDFLAYGITPEDLVEKPEMYRLTLKEYYPWIHSKGGLLYQAHPFRGERNAPADPRYLDGVEVCNAKPDNESRNELAQAFCDQNKLMEISGSDFHKAHHVGCGGVIFKECPTTMSEFIDMLRSNAILGLKRPK